MYLLCFLFIFFYHLRRICDGTFDIISNMCYNYVKVYKIYVYKKKKKYNTKNNENVNIYKSKNETVSI